MRRSRVAGSIHWRGALVTLALIVAIELFDRWVAPVTTPVAVLLLAVLYGTFSGGIRVGLVCAGLATAYAVYAFSIPGEPFHFTTEGMSRVGAAAVVSSAIVVFFGSLRNRADRAYEALRGQAVFEAQLAERQKSESELSRQRSEQRTIFHAVPAMIWFKDKENRILRANLPAAQSIGRTVEEVEGRSTYELYPEAAEKYLQDDLDVISSGEPKLGIIEAYPVGTGEKRWIRTDKLPYRDANGSIVGVIVFAVDITEQKRAQEALQHAHDELDRRVQERTRELMLANENLRREIAERQRAEELRHASEERLQQIIDNTTAVIYVKDMEGRYLLVNRRFEQLFHVRREEWAKRTDHDLFPKEAADAFRANDVRVVETGSAVEFEEIAPHDDGPHHYISLKFPLFDTARRAAGVCGISTDISQRKKTEAALLRSEQGLADLFENAAVGIHLVDRTGYILRANKAELAMLGYVREEYVGRHVREFHVDPDIVEEVLARLARGETLRQYEARMRCKNGAIKAVLIDSNVLWQDGEFVHTRCFMNDVTDRRRAEEERRAYTDALEAANKALASAREAAEAANRAKSRFLANISHEIRTPMMAMLGAAELIHALDAPTRSEINQQDIILRNGRHLLSLIDQLLDLSRIEAGKLEVRLGECSLTDLLADVEAVTEPLRRHRPVEFRTHFETPIPDSIHTDRTRLTQAIINLVSNALKFTERGHVHVRVHVDGEAAEPRLTVRVEDTGIGIRPEDRERIFETFTQVEPVSRSASAGAGLGLPIARWIAERLGGTLEVESEYGRGSLFTLRTTTGPLQGVAWLPSVSAETGSAGGRPHPGERNGRRRLRGRVLLAEDARDTRELISFALSRAGVEVTTAEDGRQAVERAAQSAFDLILLDIRMPELDGLSAAGEIRRQGYRAAMIALTASTSHGERGRILGAGFDDIWSKPIALDHLIERVAAYLDAEDTPPADRLSLAASERPSSPAGDERLEMAIAEFRLSLPDRVSRIEAAMTAGELAQAREYLHQLVGSGGIHGFPAVSDQAARLLALLKNGDNGERAMSVFGDLKMLVASVAPPSVPAKDQVGSGI